MKKTRFITEAAIIGALYAVLTIILAPISYGQVQFRISEALTILPLFTPAAIPGLFVGCIIANFFSPLGWVDVVFGASASLIAAYLTYKMPMRILAPLPPVLANGVIIGFELYYVYSLPLVPSMLWVALGELVICYGLGYPLILVLDKIKGRVFVRS